MSENEKELLLNDRDLQNEEEEKIETETKEKRISFKEGYIECDPNCQCGGVCNNCIPKKSKCILGCGCEKCKRFTKKRINQICVGAGNIFEGRLRFLFYMIFVVLLVVFLIIFLFVMLFVLLHHKGVTKPPPLKPSSKTDGVSKRNSLCKEITSENCSLFIMGYVDASSDKSKLYIEPTKNVFYVLHKPVSQQQACNIESVLRLLTDKLVYVIEFYESTTNREKDYLHYLQKRYTNLNRIRTNQSHFFQGSLFENNWSNVSQSISMLAAKILSIWQFGGLTISENILMNSRDIIDDIKEICFSDVDVAFCRQECSAYTFELMKVILNEMRSPSNYTSTIDNSLDKIIDNSINDFCSEDVAKIGCGRVYRLRKSDMCEDDTGPCRFMRMRTLEQVPNFKNILPDFCPYMMLIH